MIISVVFSGSKHLNGEDLLRKKSEDDFVLRGILMSIFLYLFLLFMVWSLVSALMYTVYTQHSPDYTEYNQLYNIFGEKVILALSHKAPLCPAVPKFNLI